MRTEVIAGLGELHADEWNRVAGTANPLLRHEFLSAMERHGCVGETFGWYPRHLLARDTSGKLLGAAPLYLKDNSYGEFVFDWSWADAYHRAGRRYYPKLVGAIPYTPVNGPRLLISPGADRDTVTGALINQALEQVPADTASSLHWLFTDATDTERLQSHGFLRRSACHFSWQNDNYRSFEDFLARLSSRKRKKIRRERRYVDEAGIRMEIRHGNEASEAEWKVMHEFYRSTFEKHSGIPTLSLEFFLDISHTMGDQLVLVFARHAGRPVAGAINLRSDSALYGRHWGCLGNYHSLHFEACYYQGIDYCIRHGLQLFEPGAQGEHKISRGFLPTLTWSAHWIADPEFRRAITHFLAREHELVLDYHNELQRLSPYRENGPCNPRIA